MCLLYRVSQKESLSLKINSTKSSSQIWMIQLLVESQKIKVFFVIFLAILPALEVSVNST